MLQDEIIFGMIRGRRKPCSFSLRICCFVLQIIFNIISLLAVVNMDDCFFDVINCVITMGWCIKDSQGTIVPLLISLPRRFALGASLLRTLIVLNYSITDSRDEAALWKFRPKALTDMTNKQLTCFSKQLTTSYSFFRINILWTPM